MSKTKTIPLEIPAEWEFDRAVAQKPFWPLPSGRFETFIRLIPTPAWTWCENPTDEMALLRPDCEVRVGEPISWSPNKRRLVAVVRSSMHHVTINDDDYVSLWRYCRVRLDRDGKVIVRWDS